MGFIRGYRPIISVGIHVVAKGASLSFFPNPASDEITFTGVVAGYSIRITNVIGQVILQDIVKGSFMNIDVSHLSPGMHFLNRTRFVKE